MIAAAGGGTSTSGSPGWQASPLAYARCRASARCPPASRSPSWSCWGCWPCRSTCARTRSASRSGWTRACRSGSPRSRCSTSRRRCGVDGSPPLYYMLLSVWMDVTGNGPGRDAGPVGGDRAAGRAGRAVGGVEPVRAPRRADLRGALRRQPVPDRVRAGDPHVRAHAGPVAGGHGRLPARVRVRPPRLPAALLGAARADALHAQLGAVPVGRPGLRAGAVLVRVRGAQELLARRADRLRLRGAALPALAADAAAPGPAHGRALAQLRPTSAPRSRSRARCSAAGRRRWRCCSPAAPASPR